MTNDVHSLVAVAQPLTLGKVETRLPMKCGEADPLPQFRFKETADAFSHQELDFSSWPCEVPPACHLIRDDDVERLDDMFIAKGL